MKGRKTGGRQKGTPNKTTVEVRAAIEEAFAALGGAGDLADWARANRDKFYTLMLTKLVPKDVHKIVSSDPPMTEKEIDDRLRQLLAENGGLFDNQG